MVVLNVDNPMHVPMSRLVTTSALDMWQIVKKELKRDCMMLIG